MTHCFDDIVEVALGAEHAARPADNPVAIWDEPRAFGGAAFEDVENVPHVVHRELRLAHAHAQPEQRGLALRLRFLRVRSSRVRQSPIP